MPEFIQQSFRSILNTSKWIDSWFWGRYSLNPYAGCSFGCLYCDARSEKYHLPEDFEEKIHFKEGAPAALRRKLLRSRSLQPDVVVLSGVTDPYQPAERQFHLTRGCLEVLQEVRWPVHIITKGRSVVDDLDLLGRIARQSWASVSFSLPVADADIARFLEPYAPDPALRLSALARIRAESPGVQTGVLMTPVVPGFGDDPEQLEQTVAAAKEAGAQYLLFGGGMTMRDKQANYFLSKMARNFPEKLKLYEQLFSFRYDPEGSYSGSYGPDKSWRRELNQRMDALCRTYELPTRIPRYLPKDYRRLNYQIAEEFLNEAWEGSLMGEFDKALHWAGMHLQNLPTSVLTLRAEGSLKNQDFLNPVLKEKLLLRLQQYDIEG